MKSIPVIVLSSSREATDLAECYRHGVNGYVIKAVAYQGFDDLRPPNGRLLGKAP